MTPAARSAGLDVIRGISLLLVMARHAFPDQFPGAGIVGVVMFFTLSGYLITGVLLRDLEHHGRIRYGRFYLRRFARLIPALTVMLLVFAVVTMTINPLHSDEPMWRSLLVAFTFTGNLPGVPVSDGLFHLWTLATEEQFYLLWPVIVAFMFVKRWALRTVIILAIGLEAVCLLTLWWAWPHVDLTYSFPTTWALALLLGSAFRLLPPRSNVISRRWIHPAVALGALCVIGFLPLRGQLATYALGAPVVAVLTLSLVASWTGLSEATQRTPWVRGLAWVGTLSYGAYLWNYPLSLWLRPHGAGWALVAAVLTLAVAWVSYHVIEEPLLTRVRSRERP